MLFRSLILFAICFFAGGLLSWVNFITKDKIAFQKYQQEQNALREVFSYADNFESVTKDGDILYYKALNQEGDVLGYCVLASRRGYSSVIETMVGIDKEGKVSGIKILAQNETPGLGVKIIELASQVTLIEVLTGKAKKDEKQKPWFEERFSNKKIADIDTVEAITGATISSEAVIKSVKEKAEEIISLVKYE